MSGREFSKWVAQQILRVSEGKKIESEKENKDEEQIDNDDKDERRPE